jgi:hypothetical protein
MTHNAGLGRDRKGLYRILGIVRGWNSISSAHQTHQHPVWYEALLGLHFRTQLGVGSLLAAVTSVHTSPLMRERAFIYSTASTAYSRQPCSALSWICDPSLTYDWLTRVIVTGYSKFTIVGLISMYVSFAAFTAVGLSTEMKTLFAAGFEKYTHGVDSLPQSIRTVCDCTVLHMYCIWLLHTSNHMGSSP